MMNWVVAYQQDSIVLNDALKPTKLSLVLHLVPCHVTLSLKDKQPGIDYLSLPPEPQNLLEALLISNASVLVFQGDSTHLPMLQQKTKNKRLDCLVFINENEQELSLDAQLPAFKEVKVIRPGDSLELDRPSYRQLDFGQMKFDVQELNQKATMKERQWQMEKEMLQQQINYFEQDKQNQAQQMKTKVKNEVEWAKRDLEKKNKEQNNKYQKEINKLEQEIERLEEENTNHIVQLDQQRYSQQSANEKSQEELQKAQQQVHDLERQLQQNMSDSAQQALALREQLEQLKNQQADPAIEQAHKRTIREKEQELSMLKTKMENEIQLITQNKEFVEQQLEGAKKQQQQTKDTYENIIKAMKDTSRDKDKEKLANEEQLQLVKQQLELQYQGKIDLLTEQLNKAKAEQEQVLGEKENRIQTLQQQLREKEAVLEQMQFSHEDQMTMQQRVSEEAREKEEERFNQILLDSQKGDKNRIVQLTQALEEYKQQAFAQLGSERESHEQALMEMKTHYEAERDILEAKLLDNKGKEAFEKALAEQQKEFEMDKQDLEEQIEELEAEVAHLKEEHEHSQESNNYIMQMKQQEINNLMKYADDLKGQLKSVQGQFEKTMGQQVAKLEEEKAALLLKIDGLQAKVQQLEKDNATLEERVSQLDKQLTKKNAMIEQVTGQKETSLQEHIVTIEQLKARLQAAGEELLDKKVQSTKDLALLQQKLDFQESLLQQAEHDKGLQEKQSHETGSAMAILRAQLEEEKNNGVHLQQQLRALQQEHQRESDIREKEKAELLRQLQGYQNANYTQSEQFQLLKNNLENEKMIIQEEMEKYKRLYSIADQEKQETQNTLDREKTLSQDRFMFLEKQKENYKNDLSDALRKFDLTLQHLKKARVNEQNDNQKNFKEVIAGLQKKHAEQLKDIKDMHRREKQAWEERSRVGEPEEEMSLKEAMKERDSQINHLQLQETKLKEQLQLKQDEYDAYLQEMHKNMEANKEMYRKKYAELDDRLKQSEQQRSLLQFEYEKEKTKWKLERGNLVSNNGEFQEIFNKQQQKRDQLLKENEKLRNNTKVGGLLSGQSQVTHTSQDYQNHGTTNNPHTMSNHSLNSNPALPRPLPSQFKFAYK